MDGRRGSGGPDPLRPVRSLGKNQIAVLPVVRDLSCRQRGGIGRKGQEDGRDPSPVGGVGQGDEERVSGRLVRFPLDRESSRGKGKLSGKGGQKPLFLRQPQIEHVVSGDPRPGGFLLPKDRDLFLPDGGEEEFRGLPDIVGKTAGGDDQQVRRPPDSVDGRGNFRGIEAPEEVRFRIDDELSRHRVRGKSKRDLASRKMKNGVMAFPLGDQP